MKIAIYLIGPSDKDGNPKRIFLIFEDNELVSVVHKDGFAAERDSVHILTSIVIGVPEYNSWVRYATSHGILREGV